MSMEEPSPHWSHWSHQLCRRSMDRLAEEILVLRRKEDEEDAGSSSPSRKHQRGRLIDSGRHCTCLKTHKTTKNKNAQPAHSHVRKQTRTHTHTAHRDTDLDACILQMHDISFHAVTLDRIVQKLFVVQYRLHKMMMHDYYTLIAQYFAHPRLHSTQHFTPCIHSLPSFNLHIALHCIAFHS